MIVQGKLSALVLFLSSIRFTDSFTLSQGLRSRQHFNFANADDRSAEMSSSVTPLQARTFAFLKGRGIIGKDAKPRAKSDSGGGGEGGRSEKENFEFSVAQGERFGGTLSQALLTFGEDERAEKRHLKQKILTGSSLSQEEQERFSILKAANKKKREIERVAMGTVLVKTRLAFRPCNESGVVDSCKEIFPMSATGTSWVLSTDRVMGKS